jgi:hypothetical protein
VCDYLSFVIVSEQKDVKHSSYLGVGYVGLSSLGLLNGIIFCSVVVFSGLLRRYAPRNDGETRYTIASE